MLKFKARNSNSTDIELVRVSLTNPVLVGNEGELAVASHHCCPKDLGTKAKLDGRLKEELQAIPGEEDLRRSSRILNALGHAVRLKIALLLLQRGHCVCEIVQLTGKRRNVVSYHLKMMKRSEVVNSGIEAGWKYYTLTDKASEMLRGLVDLRNVHHSQETPAPGR